ncbi:uncharacterized protein FIBRA_08612 [Fibroporia radiculosa]|uniref:PEBP-like protein n=1 Tax=Fibroporia radiculosa TaxID=599839 RepID=J4GX42_9APHY|nr:uncharacterized protein FIBRA_08612 [Fibroporia radiculosa]CCM06355.1 predicted protein [Fibroporia radiculosa]
MLAVRRLPRVCARLSGIRGNASLESVATASSDAIVPPPTLLPTSALTVDPTLLPASEKTEASRSEDTAQENGRKPRREWPTRRPPISLQRPREWNRPIAKGVLPTYDFALEYIREDSKALREELKEVKAALAIARSGSESDEQSLAQLEEKAKILEIQSEINLPNVRWKAWNGMADMRKLAYRHLLEQRWREDGPLDLLMERVHQMNVVPDLLPSLNPTLDLRINFPEPPPKDVYLRSRVKRRYQKVEPGVFLLPEQTWRQPVLYTTVFHTDTRLYTLLMLDLDVPDPEKQSFQSYLHWLQPNVSLSAFSPSPIPLSTTHTRYIPPHPQRGTPYHRYVVLLLPQPSTERIYVPVPSDADRLGFDFREFARQYGLDGSKGGGAHMWREVWDETVSKIYSDVLKTGEPKFGRAPKPDLYADVKATKKYV